MPSASRRGLSLIEVVAAIALLGSLLAATMTARSRLLRQQHKAELMSTAIQEVEALAQAWIQDPTSAILEGDGLLGAQTGLSWRSASRPADVPGLEATIVQLAVFETSIAENALGQEPLLEVEFLLAEPDEPVDAAVEGAP